MNLVFVYTSNLQKFCGLYHPKEKRVIKGYQGISGDIRAKNGHPQIIGLTKGLVPIQKSTDFALSAKC